MVKNFEDGHERYLSVFHCDVPLRKFTFNYNNINYIINSINHISIKSVIGIRGLESRSVKEILILSNSNSYRRIQGEE